MSYEEGAGAQARFFQPGSMVMAGGQIFVCDMGNHVIRTVNPTTGAVSTFAGDPAIRGGADGVGLLAQFNNPVSLATNGAVLFVADSGNSTVRSVDLSTREVKTLAGLAGSPGYADGNAASARFANPYALAYGNGILYVADTGNRVLRAIDLSAMEVGTVAGLAGSGGMLDGIGSAARFLNIRSMTYLDGSIYMGDGDGFSFNYSYLRKFNTSTAEVRTIMTPHRYYSNYLGLYGRKGTLFFTERNSDSYLQGSSLLAMDTATETIEIISGYPFATGEVDGDMGSARYDSLHSITGDAVNLYVSDILDSNIRRIGRAR
jgi:sugar lactone lactonase YvrE